MQARKAADVKPWQNADVQRALDELVASGAPSSNVKDGDDIAYEGIYDDVTLGFGDQFIQQTVGLMHDGKQPEPQNNLVSFCTCPSSSLAFHPNVEDHDMAQREPCIETHTLSSQDNDDWFMMFEDGEMGEDDC